MNTRKNSKVEPHESFEDPIIYQDALKIVEHLIANDVEELQLQIVKANPGSSMSMLEHGYHRNQVAEIKLKYYDSQKSNANQSERYRYLDSIMNDLLVDKNKNVSSDVSVIKEALYHLRQKYRLRIYRAYLQNVLNTLLKNKLNSELPDNIKALFLVNFALIHDLEFNLIAEEKRFLWDTRLGQRAHLHNKEDLYQSNAFQTQQEMKNSLYEEQYSQPFFETNEDSLTDRFLSDIKTLQMISSNFNYEQEDVLAGYQDSRNFYDAYKNVLMSKKLTIFKVESQSDIDYQALINLSAETLAKGNMIGAWQKWLNEREYKNEKLVLQPLVLMQRARRAVLNKTADTGGASEYLNQLTAMADTLVKKASFEFASSNIKDHAKKLAAHVGSGLNGFLDKRWKTLAFIAGGVGLGLLAITLCACTGGLSMLAFGVVHLVHVAPLVAKLFCVVSAVVVGGGVGYGGKKATDCCSGAGHNAECVQANEVDAMPVIYRSEVKAPKVGRRVEQQTIIAPEKITQPGNAGVSVFGLRH